MEIFLISLTVISSVLMIIVILLQQGKGADLGSAFGRGAQGGLFTSTGKANFLTRTTSVLVTVFLASALALSLFLGNTKEDGVLKALQESPSDDIPLSIDGDTDTMSDVLDEESELPTTSQEESSVDSDNQETDATENREKTPD